jgi:hypothetical protein
VPKGMLTAMDSTSSHKGRFTPSCRQNTRAQDSSAPRSPAYPD